MSDGANQGITAERALGTILGGKPAPKKDEGMSPAQMLEFIETAPEPAQSYDGAARLLAKHMLTFVRAHFTPDQIKSMPSEDAYEMPEDIGQGFERRWAERRITREGFSTAWERLDPTGYRTVMDAIGPTGFMYGWAYNAVRYASEMPPQPNPALLEVAVADPEPAA